jgi:hypothetical protein
MRGVVGVPDGTTADRRETGNRAEDRGTNNNADNDTEQPNEETEPPTPEEQVNGEIVMANVTEWWRGLFGIGDPTEHEAGGGGQGGQFMFASVDELNGVIKQWEDERDGIMADRDAIAEAYYMVKEPAGDDMSTGQANASRDSLASMWEHSSQMLKYTENYIRKLNASRDQMATMEDGAVAQMRSVQI